MDRATQKMQRNSGLDVLRVILSFNVIVLHLLHYGGFRSYASPSNSGFYLLWLWGIALDCVVNCFAMLSGFLSYGRKSSYASLVRIYLTVLYHGVTITLVMSWLFPGVVSGGDWQKALLPVSTREFWYFTAYTGLFLVKPILLNGMHALSKKQADILIAAILFAFSVLPTTTGKDPFFLQNGYSALWLIAMFLVGAYLRKFYAGIQLKRGKLLAIYVACIVVTAVGMALPARYSFEMGSRLIEYNSPTIVLSAITVVLLFSTIRCSETIGRATVFLSPFAFSVYLVHEQPLVRQLLIKDSMLPVLDAAPMLQVITILGTALVLWIIGFCLDFFRQSVFRWMDVDQMLEQLERRLSPEGYHVDG